VATFRQSLDTGWISYVIFASLLFASGISGKVGLNKSSGKEVRVLLTSRRVIVKDHVG
jgi:hypothetical protein